MTGGSGRPQHLIDPFKKPEKGPHAGGQGRLGRCRQGPGHSGHTATMPAARVGRGLWQVGPTLTGLPSTTPC